LASDPPTPSLVRPVRASTAIAARLQQLAEPGGIAVSRTVVDHVKHKLALAFEPLGKQRVKNITEPIGVYRLAGDATARKRSILARIMQPGMLRARLAPATILLLVAGAGAASWYFNSHHPEPIHRLSIVVLPFTNLSNDPEQEYFADAISNDQVPRSLQTHWRSLSSARCQGSDSSAIMAMRLARNGRRQLP
jgi:hypothetical protein